MDSPVALLPSKAAVSEVLKLAKGLGISVTGIGSNTLPDGARVVTAPQSTARNNVPFKYDKETRTLAIPGIYVDFVTWQYLPPQTIGGGPSLNGNKWLRIAMEVSFDPPPDFWSTVSIGLPIFEWVNDEEADPPPPGTADFIPNGDGTVYYSYILQIYNPEEQPNQEPVNDLMLVSYISTGVVKGFPTLPTP